MLVSDMQFSDKSDALVAVRRNRMLAAVERSTKAAASRLGKGTGQVWANRSKPVSSCLLLRGRMPWFILTINRHERYDWMNPGLGVVRNALDSNMKKWAMVKLTRRKPRQ